MRCLALCCKLYFGVCYCFTNLERTNNVDNVSGLFLVGGSVGVTSFQLPQRFQLVNDLDAVNAGVRLLPFGGASTVGGMLVAQVYSKFKIPLVYVVIAGAMLQIMGYALLGTVDAATNIPPKLYGYEVIAGVGCGISYLSLFAAVPFAADKRDHGEFYIHLLS